MKFFFLCFFAFILLPLWAHASLTGGDFEIYADSFSVVQDQLTTAGGNFTEYNTAGEAAGVLGSTATGTIVVGMTGGQLGLEGAPTFTLGDGVVTTTFVFQNTGGFGNGALTAGRVRVETGGGGGGTVGGMSDRVADAINNANALVEIQATSDGVGTVSLVNTRVASVDGNVPITEDVVNASFVVTGMSGGGNESSGLVLRGGFQAMERSSLSMSVDSNTVGLGTLSLSSVKTGAVVMSVTTDSSSGYAVSVTEDGNLRKGNAGVTDDIADVSDASVTAGSEEYGILTSGAAGLLATDTAIAGTVSLASYSSGVTSQQTTITFKAAIGGSTRAGSYSHIVTFTATANP